MNKNIKIKTLVKPDRESDSEQYDEIHQDAVIEETTFSIKPSTKQINTYDFFTQHEVKKKDKGKGKKKREKNKKSPNIMDLINSELGSTITPIRENVIEMVNYDKADKSLHLKNSTFQSIIQRHHLDVERGWSYKTHPVKLRPTFPKVIENNNVKEFPISVHYVEPVMFTELIAGYDANDCLIQNQKFLDFEIRNMKFTHHHKFSLETLLVVKLIEHYNEYLSIKKTLKEICRNIKVSRETKNNLKQQLIKITSGNKDVRFDATLLKYTGKLFFFKNMHMDTLKKQKEIIHKILSLWSDVEMVREKTGKTEVSYFLEITNTTMSDIDYKREWNNVFETEYSDMLDKIEYEYINAYIEYKETKNRSHLDGVDKKTIHRPKLQIDEVQLKTDTEAGVNKILIKHKIDVVLKRNKHIMKDLLKPVQVLLAHDYYLKIFVDDIFVCESDLYTCKDSMFNLEISESFSVQILPKNKTLNIILLENDANVSSVHINIEEIKKNITLTEFIPFNFIYSDHLVYPNKKYVGSGYGIKEIAVENKVRLKSGNIFKGKLTTACEVGIKIGWNENFFNNTHDMLLASSQQERQIKRFLHGIQKPNLNTLIQIIDNMYDRNIEDDELIMSALQTVSKITIKSEHTFPVNENNADNMRLKLLYLRNNGGLVNIEQKMVPLFTSQISTEQFNCLQNVNENLINLQSLENDNDIDPIDLHRYLGVKYVQRLNENLQGTVNEFLLQKTHKDVVKDFKDLSWRGLLSNQANLMTLSTSSYVLRQQLMGECTTNDQEIKMTAIRAFNLPDRATSILTVQEDAERIAGFKVRPLRPFVKLSYHGISAQSAPGIGCYPSWNQTIKIRVKLSPMSSIHVNVYDECKVNMATDPSSSRTVHYRRCSRWLGTLLVPLTTVLTLGTLHGTFKLTTPPLLIGYENTMSKEGKTLAPEVKHMIKKDISFLTLQITTSLSHLGGVPTYTQPVGNFSGDDRTIKHLNTFVTAYLNEFPSRSISLTFVDSSGKNRCVTDFLQPISLPDLDFFPKTAKSRSGSALSKSSGFSKSSSSKSSAEKNDGTNRHAEEVDREAVNSGFALYNWRIEDDQLKAINICLRYVSLIPTYEITEAQVVTLTGLELLRVLYGSPVDHTILLASYFLHLGIKCWIVTGLGSPRGLSTYMLAKYDLVTHKYTIDDQTYKSRRVFNRSGDFVFHVFDAVSGEWFELRDVACPLKTVYYVFDDKNIWVNIQSSQDCESVSFDLSKTFAWKQVFDNPRPTLIQTDLSIKSLYSAPPNIGTLQEALETKIRNKLQKWRSRAKTIWNRYCCTLLKETLSQWEYWSFNPTDPRPEPGQRLKQLMATYKMFGFPLNMHYVNTRSVMANVKASAVHANDDPDVEFALAVRMYAYPNNVISIWVFLASITRI